MTPDELIGSAGASVIAELAHGDEPSGGTARFLLDRLTDAQVAAVCKAIGSSPVLSSEVQMRIPRGIGMAVALPEEILTDERSTYWRNADCDLPILVLANTDDDQGQSLKDVTAVGSNELLSSPSLWVECAAENSTLPDSQIKWWTQALKGLLEAKPLSLDMFARYVLATRAALDEGLPIVEALGRALPALRAPRDSAYFNGIPKNSRNHAVRWRRLYHKLFTSRVPYLVKSGPNQQPIGKETLLESFNKVKDEIDPQHHPLFENFIESESNWNDSSQALADLEWEQDKVKSLFDGLRVKREPLGRATLEFYEDELPVALSDEDRDYLDRLDKRNTRETNEEDNSFYEQHRIEIAHNRGLKVKWEKFVFGQPLEDDDFLVGFLRILERLYEQAGATADSRSLIIECRRSRRDWLEMNFDAVTCFARSYRGLQVLTRDHIDWQVPHLFAFDQLVREEEKKGRYERSDSTKRSANQIKFIFHLVIKRAGTETEFSSQLIWNFNPESVLAQFDDDWRRLEANAFTHSRVNREVVSPKGRLQSLDLEDTSTMMPVFRQDRGSLISAYDPDQDLAAIFVRQLEQAFLQRRLTAVSKDSIQKAWNMFSEAYAQAVKDSAEFGSAAETWLTLTDKYRELLDCLALHSPGDRNHLDLWQPVLSIGTTIVDGGPPCAIVTPWHPMRMLSAAIKVRSIAGLTRLLLDSETVNFGDARMFFRDLASELVHPYYPEVCLGASGNQPLLLSISQICGDYSIMEAPCRPEDAQSSTNDDPRAAAGIVIRLLRRYLDLQPHEDANLTAVLYNCDSARLPQAVVQELSGLYEDGNEEVRCQIVLRHGDTRRLNDLYGALLKISEDSSDLFVGSEASRDFMSRLRISIMADQAQVPSELSGPPADIVFLHDVIARAAELCWIEETKQHSPVEVLSHVPPRWSKRRPASRDDLKSTTYLACPLQPSVGWAYLRLVHGVVTGNDGHGNPLPARRISFQDNKARSIFDEVHRLGQWVVNYDELLTKRQLRNLGVQVIRYQKLRDEDRNLLISSTAPLNLLNVLVQKRLRALNLGLDADQVQAFATRMLDLANEISGDIVLRAAKHGCFANELIGLVLSRFLIEDEIGTKHHIGWFFLDDYADWLGQKEEHIADILAFSPQMNGDRHQLVAIVGEAKLVTSDGVSSARRTSEVQLRETLARIQDALFGDPGRLDRDLWLGRFADLILDGVEVAPGEQIRIEEWRDAIRDGRVDIVLQGYSHVFVHEEGSERLDSTRTEVAKVADAWQETFNRDAVRELLLRFYSGASPRDIREALGWTSATPHGKPASNRVMWSVSAVGDRSPAVTTLAAGHTPAPSRDPSVVETPGPSAKEPERAEKVPNPPAHARSNDDQDAGSFGWAPPRLRETLASLESGVPNTAGGEEWLNETTKKLRSALLNYGFQAKLLDQRLTPNSALVRFQGSDRLKVSDVEGRRSQLLTTNELRVIRVAAEPGAVVITVARPEREVVSLVNVLRNRVVDDAQQRTNQSLIVGIREATGGILYLSPGRSHAPHTLIAGSTGSGKSVLLQNLILDIAMTNSSAAARITLIDPKQGVDYFALEPLPHLGGRVVVEQQEAQQILETIVGEMDNRYRLFRTARVGNIGDYNRQVTPEQRLPVLWLVHDEFAEWMLIETYKDLVSATVQRLGIKARAAGIFLIFAAQRPEDKVMPVQLRDNLGNRLVLRVESEGTSRIALLEEGAERLLGKGHLAARLQGEDDLVITQVPILKTEEIELIVKAVTEGA